VSNAREDRAESKRERETSMASPVFIKTQEYQQFLAEVKTRVLSSRVSAATAINRELMMLYWDIGRGIMERQAKLGWGKSVVETLAKDLRREFPASSSFSADNLWRMRQLYAAYTHPDFLGQLVPEMKLGLKSNAILEQPVPESGVAIDRAVQLILGTPYSIVRNSDLLFALAFATRRPQPPDSVRDKPGKPVPQAVVLDAKEHTGAERFRSQTTRLRRDGRDEMAVVDMVGRGVVV